MLLGVVTRFPNESHGVQGVAGSNPAVPTELKIKLCSDFCCRAFSLVAPRAVSNAAQATIVYKEFVWLNWMLHFPPTVNAMPEKVAQFVETFRRQFNIAKP